MIVLLITDNLNYTCHTYIRSHGGVTNGSIYICRTIGTVSAYYPRQFILILVSVVANFLKHIGNVGHVRAHETVITDNIHTRKQRYRVNLFSPTHTSHASNKGSQNDESRKAETAVENLRGG